MSKIRFNSNLSGKLSVDEPSGQVFTIDFYYEIEANCDNVGTDGEDYNQATTTLEIGIDGNYTVYDSVSASVSGGNFPISQNDSQLKAGTFQLVNITDPTKVSINVIVECDYGRNGKGGYGSIKIVSASVDTGSVEVICSNRIVTYCSGSYLDCDIPTPTTTTTTTPSITGTTTTTTTTPIPTSFTLSEEPEGLLYTRSPIVYRYTGCDTGRTYEFKLYTTMQSTLTEYLTFTRSVDLLTDSPGIVIDIANLLTEYIRNNMIFNGDNIIFFRLDALEYRNKILSKIITGTKLLATMGYVDGGRIILPLKQSDIN